MTRRSGYSIMASTVSGVSVSSVVKKRPPTEVMARGALRSSAHVATSKMCAQKSMNVPPE
jgi:hypothetical protein